MIASNINEEIQEIDISIQFEYKIKQVYSIFDKIDDTKLIFRSIMFNNTIRLSKTKQCLILYIIDILNFSLDNLNKFQLIKNKCNLLYDNKVKLVLVAYAYDDSSYFDTILFLHNNYDCIFQSNYNYNPKEGLVYINEDGIIQEIEIIDSDSYSNKYSLNEKIIMIIIMAAYDGVYCRKVNNLFFSPQKMIVLLY